MTREQLAQWLTQHDKCPRDSKFDTLNEVELEVFSILSQGYTAAQIHTQFGFAPARLSQLKRSLQKKLGLKNELQLLRLAAEQSQSN